MKFKEFLVEKGLSNEEFSKLEGAKQAELFNEHNEVKRKEIEEAIDAKASKEDISSLKEEFRKGLVDQQKALNIVLKDMGVAIKASLPGEKKEEVSLKSLLSEKKMSL